MAISPLSQPGASARVPDAPTSISATAVSGGQASVSFTASTNPGKPSGNYVVTSSPGSFTASGASSPITVTGLSAGTAYTFTVVKQSGSGITSATSGASGSITAFSSPTFGTQTGSSTAATVSGTTSVTNVNATSGTLQNSPGAGATFYDYQRISGTAVTPSGGSLTGLASKTAHEWRARVTNNSSSFDLTTRVTPNGSATAVSVAFGTDGVTYGSSATSSGNTSVNIGSGLSEVSTTWSLTSSSSAATIHYRVTATYAGGATVQTTGSIARTVTIYNATSVAFETYGTYTYYSNTIGATLSVLKRSYGVDLASITGTLVGGGGGGVAVGAATGPSSYAGGGGGGDVEIFTGLTGAAIEVSRGAGGAPGQYGGYTTAYIYSVAYSNSTVYTGYFGTPGAGSTGGATYLGGSSYNYGTAGAGTGGGGGGAGGSPAAGDYNGGAALSGYGPGGPGYFNFGGGYAGTGDWGSGGTSTSYGAGGSGGSSGTAGQNGFFAVSYVGPYRSGGALGDA